MNGVRGNGRFGRSLAKDNPIEAKEMGITLRGRGFLLMCLVATLGAGGAARANEREPVGERMIYDPQTGQWIEETPPEPGTEQGDLEIAKRLLARGDKDNAKKAEKLLDKWVKTYGQDSELYPEALFYRADADFLTEDYMKAHERYQEYINQYPGTELADRAQRRDFVVAEVFLSGKRKKTWGMRLFRAYDEALEMLDEIAIDNPDSTLAEQAIKTKADFHYRRGEFDMAEEEYARLAREFPNSRYARLAMLLSARSALASFPGIEFDDAPLVEAQERFEQFQTQYPVFAREQQVAIILDQIHSTRAQKEFSIGDYYQRTHARDAAAFYYRSVLKNFSDTTWASLAAGRLEALGKEVPMPGPGIGRTVPASQPGGLDQPNTEVRP